MRLSAGSHYQEVITKKTHLESKDGYLFDFRCVFAVQTGFSRLKAMSQRV